jgi:hypothetical protein
MKLNHQKTYILSFVILMALGGLTFYANQQSKRFEVSLGSWTPIKLLNDGEGPLPGSGEEENFNSDSSTYSQPIVRTTNIKTQSFIVIADLFKADPDKIQLIPDIDASIIFRADKLRSGPGLEFRSEQTGVVKVPAGESKKVNFKTNKKFVIDVYKINTSEKLPFSISVEIK